MEFILGRDRIFFGNGRLFLSWFYAPALTADPKWHYFHGDCRDQRRTFLELLVYTSHLMLENDRRLSDLFRDGATLTYGSCWQEMTPAASFFRFEHIFTITRMRWARSQGASQSERAAMRMSNFRENSPRALLTYCNAFPVRSVL